MQRSNRSNCELQNSHGRAYPKSQEQKFRVKRNYATIEEQRRSTVDSNGSPAKSEDMNVAKAREWKEFYEKFYHATNDRI